MRRRNRTTTVCYGDRGCRDELTRTEVVSLENLWRDRIHVARHVTAMLALGTLLERFIQRGGGLGVLMGNST